MEEWPRTSSEQSLHGVSSNRPEGSESELITIVVKGSADIQDFQVAERTTVGQLKEEVAPYFKVTREQVLLIFAGKILKDQETLLQHDIHEGLTVYLVVKKPELRGQLSLSVPSVGLTSSSTHSPLDSGSEVSRRGSGVPALLGSSQRDLMALMELLPEVPLHFQACPELMSEVLKSSAVEGMISNNCSPLAVTFILAVATALGLSATGKAKPAGREQIAQALEKDSVRDILANTKQMAQFLSESPELRQFAQETPHFSIYMTPNGLSKMVATYAKLLHLGSTLATEAEMSLVADMLDDVHSFHRLFIDVGKVFSSSEAQEELEDRLLRHILATNPALQQLAEENVQLGHLLKNPQVVEEIVKYIRSPEIRHEVDRHADQALSNLESQPGGFNHLLRMYQEVEEPLWNAVQGQQEEDLSAAAPSLAGGGQSSAGGSQIPPGMENRAPLPDPWAPPHPDGKSSTRNGAEDGGSHRSQRDSAASSVAPSVAPNAAPSVGSQGKGGRQEMAPKNILTPGSNTAHGEMSHGSSHSWIPSFHRPPETQASGAKLDDQEKTLPLKAKASPGPLANWKVSKEDKEGHQGAPEHPKGSKGP